MRLLLDYGSDGLPVDLPDDRTVVVAPRHTAAVACRHRAEPMATPTPRPSSCTGEVTATLGSDLIRICDTLTVTVSVAL